ncbi:protein jim lovell [Chelonus insularis]|uniref:protein jim lovell n=1 Tax=Chelonus insularis TaxID=460826 RepID=UPI00158C7942|nr:protein jim lovell [Chelonus insularis]XP_034941580.1 protein jim lovell [Chelonus insularis]XP_034941581.1 protein jim lovell [Chelonus insularis]XP_034941582.1 protein jim lovell [Chelonus insularis]
MSSTAESPDGGMALQSHYSLRWNNHQTHILQAFEALLHAEIFVDVTLVCSESSLRAHKVVLSACSPFFERIFAEHPCKHPVIVLKDFSGREVAALIDFMYRGEVRVGREELPGLMRAAESLQVRGLASSEPRPASPPDTPVETPTDLLLGDRLTPEATRQESPVDDDNVSDSAITPTRDRGFIPREHRDRLPHMSHLNFSLRELRESCNSPLPRRKQARPRRRSGELIPQDLSKPHPPPSPSPPSGLNFASNQQQSQQQQRQTSPPNFQHQIQQPTLNHNQREDIAENLSMKRPSSPSLPPVQGIKTESEAASSPRGSPLTGTSLHPDSSIQDLSAASLPAISTLSLTPPHHHSEYLTSLGQLAAQWAPSHPQSQLQNPSHHPREGSPQSHNRMHPFQQQESALTSRRSVAVFPMDTGGGLFPHGGGLDRGSFLADLHDSFKPEALHGLFGGNLIHPAVKKQKKHRGDSDGPRRWSDHTRMQITRPKGQHSAPRGGPPRSWTNAELTEALQHVWNKKMTTSQASRIFGIPYNSLLMYVRGKYGKSLKLEQLRRDCTGATTGEVMNSLNNNVKAIQPPPQLPHPLAGLTHPEDGSFPHHPLLSGNLPQSFFPDFSATFPVPVNMVHLLPPSEQKAIEPPTNPGGISERGGGSVSAGSIGGTGGVSDLTPSSRSPSPANNIHESIPTQSAPALLQQNGSE